MAAIEAVPFCGCTNEQLEAGRTCGLPECPNLKGARVRLRRQVDRFPHFIAPQGATGTVSAIEPDGAGGIHGIDVTMDEHLPGAEDWDNAVCWYDADLPAFREDVEVAR